MAVWISVLVALLAACAAPQGQVVLLPERDGRATAVEVTQAAGALSLTEPYATARLTRNGPRPATSTPEQVQARFGAALAALPLPPTRFTLYFVEGKDEFTDDSRRGKNTLPRTVLYQAISMIAGVVPDVAGISLGGKGTMDFDSPTSCSTQARRNLDSSRTGRSVLTGGTT
jgi:hypothetical protein